MRRGLVFAGIVAVVAAALLVWRLEPIYLERLAGKTQAEDLEARKALLSDAIEIHVPDAEDNPYPTVLMFHGCAGPRMTFQRQWAEVFNEAGYAAMIVDSTGPRGYSRQSALDIVCAGKTLIGQERAGDVFAAIEIAREDPRLDTDRLILAGWSHGAWTVMDFLTMDGEKRRPAGLSGDLPGQPRIDGTVLFYPHCGAGALSKFRPWRQSPPALAFVAGADQIVEPEKCIALFDRMRWAGLGIEVAIYPDAEHVFDDPFLEPEWIHWYSEKDHKDAEQRLRAFLDRLPD